MQEGITHAAGDYCTVWIAGKLPVIDQNKRLSGATGDLVSEVGGEIFNSNVGSERISSPSSLRLIVNRMLSKPAIQLCTLASIDRSVFSFSNDALWFVRIGFQLAASYSWNRKKRHVPNGLSHIYSTTQMTTLRGGAINFFFIMPSRFSRPSRLEAGQ